MRLQLLILYIVLFVLSTSIVIAVGTTSYPYASGIDYDWRNEGRGEFVRVGEDFDTYGKSLSNPLNMPIIDDFDNNSVNEILVVDGDSVEVYRNKELTLLDAVDIGDVPRDISNIISYDIDADGKKEIIFHAENIDGITDKIMILNWSETDGIQIQNSFEASQATTYMPSMIACREANECITICYGGYYVNTFNPFTHYLRAYSFDSLNVTSSATTLYSETQPSSDGLTICTARTKNIIVKDYDYDGEDEYIFSFADKDETDDYATYHMVWLDNLTVIARTDDDSDDITEMYDDCGTENGLSNLFTSPVVDNLFTAYANDEAIMAVQKADEDFQLWIYSSEDYEKKQSRPDVTTSDGVIISNVVIGNFFTETGTEDFCVMGFVGYDETDIPDIQDELELLCGTEDRFPNEEEFKFSTAGMFNVSTDEKDMHVAIHAVQHSNALQSGIDLNEILSAYGIFSLDYVGINEITLDWENPAGDSVLLSIDAEKFGFDDLLAMTDTNLIYYDDGISNEPAVIESVLYNPCPFNTMIKVNTTMQFTLHIRDLRGGEGGYDDVNANIYVYYGTTNQQNDTYRNVSTSQVDGTTTIYSNLFEINKTGLDNRILIQVWDNGVPNEVYEIDDVTFDVALQGIEFGDITCEEAYEIEEAEIILPAECNVDDDCPTGYICVNNECVELQETAPVEAMRQFAGAFGISTTIVWLMFMLGLAVGFWFAPVGSKGEFWDSANARLGAIIIGEIIMLILGTMFGVLHVAIIISFIVLSLIAISIWVVRKFTGVGI